MPGKNNLPDVFSESNNIMQTDEQIIRKMFDDYLRMYASRDDRLTACFSEDFSGFTGGGDNLVKNKDEWIAITRQDFAQIKDPIRIELKDLAIQPLAKTIAVVTGFFTIHLPIEDHILSRETARLVLIFHKESEGWKISHSSISIPYYLVGEGEVYPLKELTERNKHLEEQVAERTFQLSKANDILHRTNEELASEVAERKRTEQALRESDELLRRAELMGEFGSWETDLTTREVTSSEGARTIYGSEGHELTLDLIQSAPLQEYRTMLDDALYGLVFRDLAYDVEFKIKRESDGAIVDIHSIAGYDKNTQKVTGMIQDVSERKLTEQALRESEQSYRSLANSGQALIWTAGTDKGCYYFNRVWLDFTGRSLEQEMGNGWTEGVHPEDLPRCIQIYVEAFDRRVPFSMEYQLRRYDGAYRWILDDGCPRYDSNGEFTGYIGHCLDVTDRKRAEEALHESEYLFKESQRAAFIGSYKMDFRINLWESSEVLNIIFGIDNSYNRSVTGWLEIVHPDDRDAMAQYLREEVISKRMPFSKEYRIIRKNDGDSRWVYGLGKASFDDNGNILLLIGTIQDITEHKLADEEKLRLEAQLQQAQKMESVGRLAGGVAHDFNNMLGVILGYTELIKMKLDPAHPMNVELNEIQQAAQRSADLTRQLLAFARKQAVTPKVLDLNDTVAGMLNMLQRLIGEDIELVWLPQRDLWQIKVDPSQIDQLMANLCVNSRDAISGVGKIIIETRNITIDEDFCAIHAGFEPGDYGLLTVSDNGCGMDGAALSHLFEPFFTTKEMGKGTGLGLATVYGIVKQNNGFVNVYSEPGHGATFKVYLPRYAGKPDQFDQDITHAKIAGGKETILLVEDELAILNLGISILTQLGYKVLSAITPGEAIMLAENYSGEIHLLLTDVVMPEMNGRDLARRLLTLYPNLKRLFMSGYTADVIAHHGVLDEGVNFLQKPFSVKGLTSKVREVLA